MTQKRRFLALLINSVLLGSFLPLTRTAAVPVGADIYFFVGNETGLRQPVKSNGNGTFTFGTSFTYGDNNRGAAALEDYDSDGDLDAVMCAGDAGTCHLFVQSSPGTFTQSTNVQPSGFGLAGIESGMAADDFNQDGHADVLIGGNTNQAAIYFGNGAGGFPTFIDNLLPTIGGGSYREKDSGDLDGNGHTDVVIGIASTGEVHSYLNNGDGTFSGPNLLFDTTGLSNAVFALTVADFDRDRLLDIIAGGASDGEVALFKGNGTGNSSTSFTLVGPVYDFDTQSAVDSYDFDGDKDQDLVAVKRTTGEVFYFAGNGNGTFLAPVLLGSVTPSAFGTATSPAPPILPEIKGRVLKDLNGNGLDDDGGIGIELVSLSLIGTNYLGHPVSRTAVTAADGSYSFRAPISNAAGYTLKVTTPVAGLATATETRTVSVPRAHSVVTENFLYLPFSKVQGTVFDDTNGDGNQNEPGGWVGTTLALTGTNYQGTAVSRSATTTDTSGAFTFDGLLPSNAAGYTIAVTTAPSGATATTPTSATVAIPLGELTVTRNFGYVGDSIIEGAFFHDQNNDGVNTDDPGGWLAFNPDQLYSLKLTGTDFQGGSVDRTVTGAANGAYAIGALKLSNAAGYTLAVTSTPPAELNNPTTTTSRTVVINQGSSLHTHDFGYRLICTDGDSDGFRSQGGLCGPKDCNDANIAVNPAAAEVCNGIDDNCDGVVDESFPDADGDGVTTCAGDCNDTNAAIKPGATEVCNLVDDNCNALIDEGFDVDGDGFTSCAGDCNDTVAVGQEGFLTVNITSISSSGPGANMTDAVFVGNGAIPFGVGSVTIPLSLNRAAIVDPASSVNVAGLHVLRGKDATQGPFIRITADGFNAQEAREVVTASFTLAGAHVTTVQNGPMEPYEGQGNGSCEAGKPSKDEYVIPANGTTGTLCSTTNVDSDTVTIFYALESTLACNEVTNPATQCSDPQFQPCGVCIHPGAPDPFTDGIDSNCDALAECTEKKNYAAGTKCEGTVTVTTAAALDTYIANFGFVDGKFQHLKINFNVSRARLDIHSPCRITEEHGRTITGTTALCLDGRKGVRLEGSNILTAPRLALLSEQRGVRIGAQSTIDATIEMVLRAFRRVRVGVDSILKGGAISLTSEESEHAVTSVGARATITAASLSLTAEKKAKLGPHTKTTVTGNFHMDAPRCSIANSATITAGSKTGGCFTAPAAPASESDREEQEEGKKDERDTKDEEE